MAEFIYQMYQARKAHGDKVILDDVTLSFYPGAKIGVVGPNGMGKSTLLKIMAGIEEVSNGDAKLTPGYTVGILQQEPPLDDDKTVIENVRMAFGDMIAKVDRFNKIGEEMCDPDCDMDALMVEMGKLQDEIDAADGWDIDSKLGQAMDALQLPDSDMPVNVLSGGERRRVALCKLLLEAPDLLLLDDVQFIAGKERTQEEFFHTFNALYEAKKQIVLTSDRPPKEINTLEERMKTRFEWGLLADIQPPDFETRIAIIRDKAVKMSIELPDEVSNYIAENIQSNIRQLEGAVKKIKAMHELMGERITVSLAENAIDALRTENPGLNPTPERIMEAVANYFYIPVEQMISKDRSKDVAYPRQMAMYMIRQELEYSFPDIAKIFKRDHTTVMHACNKIEEERKKSRQTEDVIKKLHNNIRGD